MDRTNVLVPMPISLKNRVDRAARLLFLPTTGFIKMVIDEAARKVIDEKGSEEDQLLLTEPTPPDDEG